MSNVVRKKSFRKSSGIKSVYKVNKCWKASIPVLMSILVYIEEASVVNNLAFCGKVKFFKSCINLVEFFM